jgi:cytochrome c oxidase cbb3-type subunit 1
LVAGNLVGWWLATLLLWPAPGAWLGGLGYGRWVPVHLNLQLYGWTSLPLVAWLFTIYEVHGSRAGRWAPAAVWAWSAALACGAVSWLAGRTSGKIFLDWQGGALWALLVAQGLLWLVLAGGLASARRRGGKPGWRLLGLLGLALVPLALWRAADPAVYPPVDPSTGGPTGVSLLGSTLAVVWILLAAPRTLLARRSGGGRAARGVWVLWFAELVVFLLLEPLGGKHADWWQVAALGLLLPWPVLVARDWRGFVWPEGSAPWRGWALGWWALLVLSGWVVFLPGVLDRLKFTSGLVAHSHLAMAGFTSAFCLLLLGCLLPAWRAATGRFHAVWNVAVAVHVAVLAAAGWREGGDHGWMLETAGWRHACFGLRWLAGAVMLGVSIRWLRDWHRERCAAEPS